MSSGRGRVGNRQRRALIVHGSNMPNYPILSSPLQCKRLLLRVVIIHGEHPASPLLPSHPLLSIFLPEKNVFDEMKWLSQRTPQMVGDPCTWPPLPTSQLYFWLSLEFKWADLVPRLPRGSVMKADGGFTVRSLVCDSFVPGTGVCSAWDSA